MLVRLQAPRFLVERDESVFSAVVQNDHDSPKTVKVSLELDGNNLEAIDGAPQRVIRTKLIDELEKAKLLLNEEVQFTSFARKLRGKLEGKVIVGSSCAPGTRIGELLTAMRTQHPLITVDLLAKPSSEVRQGLTNGELDVGILLGQPSIDLDVTHHELARREYCVAGPVGWKDQIESANWRELAKLPWITSSPGTSATQAMISPGCRPAAIFAKLVARMYGVPSSRSERLRS